MDEQVQAVILSVVERAPQWIRRDLEAKDTRSRARAEETLSAMIGNALKEAMAQVPAETERCSAIIGSAMMAGAAALSQIREDFRNT